jgi:uncharacterized membrane protein (UPF0127 family)
MQPLESPAELNRQVSAYLELPSVNAILGVLAPTVSPMNLDTIRRLPIFSTWRMALIGAWVTLAVAALAQSGPQLQLPRTPLQAGMHVLDVQLAQTPEQRQIGLMWRQDMPQHEGMLFVFEQAAMQCFWMRNTLIPLSAAFLADDGTIVNIADMKPKSDDSHCSDKPVRFVLEMNVGWFAKRQIKPGYKLGGAPFKR